MKHAHSTFRLSLSLALLLSACGTETGEIAPDLLSVDRDSVLRRPTVAKKLLVILSRDQDLPVSVQGLSVPVGPISSEGGNVIPIFAQKGWQIFVATPDGSVPRFDITGASLPFNSGENQAPFHFTANLLTDPAPRGPLVAALAEQLLKVPALARVEERFRGQFAHISAVLSRTPEALLEALTTRPVEVSLRNRLQVLRHFQDLMGPLDFTDPLPHTYAEVRTFAREFRAEQSDLLAEGLLHARPDNFHLLSFADLARARDGVPAGLLRQFPAIVFVGGRSAMNDFVTPEAGAILATALRDGKQILAVCHAPTIAASLPTRPAGLVVTMPDDVEEALLGLQLTSGGKTLLRNYFSQPGVPVTTPKTLASTTLADAGIPFETSVSMGRLPGSPHVVSAKFKDTGATFISANGPQAELWGIQELERAIAELEETRGQPLLPPDPDERTRSFFDRETRHRMLDYTRPERPHELDPKRPAPAGTVIEASMY